MKVILSICLYILLSVSAYGAELSIKSLQGNWVIVELMGEANNDGDSWEFIDNEFYQRIKGMNVRPDEYNISPGIIDLGYGKITVTSFDGETMEAVMGGFKYILKKQ